MFDRRAAERAEADHAALALGTVELVDRVLKF
jgi:hypothetical protein